jgi:site-specific DNA recombinase
MTGNYVLALYLRLSQEDRDIYENGLEESNSITAQRELLYEFLRNHSKFEKAQIVEFCDDGYSGTSFDRPGVKDLIKQAKSGNIQCIVVKDFSRFGRNYIEVGNYLEQVFPFLNVRFISVNDNFDSNKGFGAVGNIDVAFKNLIYDFYSKDLSQKAISGRNAKAIRGEYLPAYAPYGYQKVNIDGSKTIVVDEEAAIIVKRIFDMSASGISKSEIARTLNDQKIPSPVMLRKQRGEHIVWHPVSEQTYWTSSVIRSILKDERYLGHFQYGKTKPVTVGSKKRVCIPKDEWIIIPNHHEAVLSQELFDKVQVNFPKQKEAKSREIQSKTSPLSGKLRCAGCNHTLTKKRLKRGVFYYCSTKNYISECDCFKGNISESELEEQLLTVISTMAQTVDTLSLKTKNQQKDDSLVKQKQLKEIQVNIDKLLLSKVETYEQYKGGELDKEAFRSLDDKISLDIEKLNSQSDNIGHEMQAINQYLISKESGICEALEEQRFADTLKKVLVDLLIDTIYLNKDGSIQIIWAFTDIFGEIIEKEESEV